jgi:MYXO-CTERM domain-containing protein
MAIAAALTGTNPAEASIIFHDGGDATTNGSTPVTFNMQTGSVGTSEPGMDFALRFFGSNLGSYSYAAASATALGSNPGLMLDTCGCVFKLGAGALIGPLGSFGPQGLLASQIRINYSPSFPGSSSSSSGSYVPVGGTFMYGPWQGVPGRGFLGLKFVIGPNTYFGWADVTVNENYTAALHSFAYEACADQSIDAGQTTGGAECDASEMPEPHSAALLALGAAGIAAYRRRRNAA